MVEISSWHMRVTKAARAVAVVVLEAALAAALVLAVLAKEAENKYSKTRHL